MDVTQITNDEIKSIYSGEKLPYKEDYKDSLFENFNKIVLYINKLLIYKNKITIINNKLEKRKSTNLKEYNQILLNINRKICEYVNHIYQILTDLNIKYWKKEITDDDLIKLFRPEVINKTNELSENFDYKDEKKTNLINELIKFFKEVYKGTYQISIDKYKDKDNKQFLEDVMKETSKTKNQTYTNENIKKYYEEDNTNNRKIGIHYNQGIFNIFEVIKIIRGIEDFIVRI
jgi:hypothetical protein